MCTVGGGESVCATASTSNENVQMITFRFNTLRGHVRNTAHNSKSSEETMSARAVNNNATPADELSDYSVFRPAFSACFRFPHYLAAWCVFHRPFIRHRRHTFTRWYEVLQRPYYYRDCIIVGDTLVSSFVVRLHRFTLSGDNCYKNRNGCFGTNYYDYYDLRKKKKKKKVNWTKNHRHHGESNMKSDGLSNVSNVQHVCILCVWHTVIDHI